MGKGWNLQVGEGTKYPQGQIKGPNQTWAQYGQTTPASRGLGLALSIRMTESTSGLVGSSSQGHQTTDVAGRQVSLSKTTLWRTFFHIVARPFYPELFPTGAPPWP